MKQRSAAVPWRLGFAIACGLGIAASPGWAAETIDPIPMATTIVALKLDAAEAVDVQTTFRQHPPTIVVQFPDQRVIGSLPSRSAVATGVIQEIEASYQSRGIDGRSRRFLESVEIILNAPYTYRVRSEVGRIVVEIDHPASVSTAAVEVGLKRGTITGALKERRLTERFQAMQEAMAQATPTSWSLRFTESPGAEAPQAPAPTSPVSRGSPAAPARAEGVSLWARAAGGVPQPSTSPPRGSSSSLWVIAAFAFGAATGMGLLRYVHDSQGGGDRSAGRSGGRVAPGLLLIDQLVWKAFERQGYQLITETDVATPVIGTLRVVSKDGEKAALLLVSNGPFFEKQTVERCIQLMRETSVERGFLVASGSFTVPAQRVAKAHHLHLIGREQLPELLSAGASSEYFTKQLEQQHARLEEAKETLRQYAGELDTLRRQRNEASWYLGEERARSAKLEGELDSLRQQLRGSDAELARWQDEAASLRREWEEAQWYLGESRSQTRHVLQQLDTLQNAAEQSEGVRQQRDDANWYLGEERAKREAIAQRLDQLQHSLEESTAREQLLQSMCDQLARELEALRTHWGERRSRTRLPMPEAHVELRNGAEEPFFAGAPRDLSSDGLGLETDQALPDLPSFRLRMVLPGRDPIESGAQLVWQRTDSESPRYLYGCRLTDIPESSRMLIEECLQQSQPKAA